jgi:hypothetical protein
MGTIRSQDDLKKAFEVQLAALSASCASYDQGADWEAVRMATSVHLLVHDAGRRNTSLLTQLGIKQSLQFIASGYKIDPMNLMASTPLVMIELRAGAEAGVRYKARLDATPNELRRLSFGEWWERDKIFQTGKNDKSPQSLSRRRLVFALRNKEGGSHYDPVLEDPGYIRVSQEPVWMAHSGGKEHPLLQLELASMRQVTWELLQTLQRRGSDS